MRRLLFLATVTLVAAGMIGMGLPSAAVAEDIKVGAVINLTGPASTWGQFHAKGQQDYFRYINEVKGGISGNKIDLTVVDHAYKVPEALKYVKKFCTADKMDMIATWDAGSGIMAKPIIQKYKVPNINYSTYQGILKPPVDYAYLPFGSYVMDCYAVLGYINAIHKGSAPPKVGLLTYNNAYGKSIHDPSQEYASKHNIDIVAVEQFPPKSLDLKTELLRLKDKGAEYIFMQCLPSAIIMALESADRVQFDVPFFGTWTSTDPDFFKRGKGLIRDRMHMQFPGCLPGDDNPGIKLLTDLWERYGTVSKFDTAYWEGVTVGAIMAKAFQRAHDKLGKTDSEAINVALETFQNEDFGGLVPNITYTDTDHSASFTARIVKINEDQTFEPLTKFWNPKKEKVTLLK
ncbi:MAG: ABC transporter substrate-binding protein [Deltaproteobacteria bacterium]|nr:ABC transporter substrate-binding protein [Deltaproteobacteria bacterium]MCF8118683.1 ABC transporter substrate-binding protein [Deltaproteobacteria bacterium]